MCPLFNDRQIQGIKPRSIYIILTHKKALKVTDKRKCLLKKEKQFDNLKDERSKDDHKTDASKYQLISS
jgi:hypothetical protein